MFIALIVIGLLIAAPLSFFGVRDYFGGNIYAVWYMTASLVGWILLAAGLVGYHLETHLEQLKKK